MAFAVKQVRPGRAWEWAVLLVASATIVAALAFEHIGGYVPCPLCLQQRYAYYGALPAAAVAMWLLADRRPRLARGIFAAIALAFLINAGLGIYQAGAEWKYWPGPESCAGSQALSTSAGGLLDSLKTVRVIRCDDAAWRFAGLSFAGWNAVVSLLLAVAGTLAALRPVANRVPH